MLWLFGSRPSQAISDWCFGQRSRAASCAIRCTGDRSYSITLRVPRWISALIHMPGTRAVAAKYQEKFGRPAPWGFAHVRVHDLKHTFGRRLRAAGVGEETRKVLLGHTNGDITTHYSTAELAELITAVNKIDRSLATPAITLLRTAA